ncbi:MAG TPA: nuclear transport factor 2 family protein [Caulobacteraceae bacterium]|nr:nuclear transport factor 2 family protein [Caulobacteraceae bacterium]
MNPLIFVAALASLPLAEPAPASQDAVQVEKTFMAGIEAFNAHDLDRFMVQFDPELQMFTPTGWLRGGAAVRARFSETFARFPAVRMEIDRLKAKQVSDDTVVVTFAWTVRPQGAGPAFEGVGSGVYVRRPEGWREVIEHETVTRTHPDLARSAPK